MLCPSWSGAAAMTDGARELGQGALLLASAPIILVEASKIPFGHSALYATFSRHERRGLMIKRAVELHTDYKRSGPSNRQAAAQLPTPALQSTSAAICQFRHCGPRGGCASGSRGQQSGRAAGY